MLETRPEFSSSSQLQAITHRQPHLLKPFARGRVAVDIGQQGDIIARPAPGKMGLQDCFRRAVLQG